MLAEINHNLQKHLTEAAAYFQALHPPAVAEADQVEMVKLTLEMVDRVEAAELAILNKLAVQEILHQQAHHKETTAEMETVLAHGAEAVAEARLQMEQRRQLIKAEMVEQEQPILIQDHR